MVQVQSCGEHIPPLMQFLFKTPKLSGTFKACIFLNKLCVTIDVVSIANA